MTATAPTTEQPSSTQILGRLRAVTKKRTKALADAEQAYDEQRTLWRMGLAADPPISKAELAKASGGIIPETITNALRRQDEGGKLNTKPRAK